MENKLNLPPRLRQITILLSRGKTRKQIAQETGLSVGTIKTYISRLYTRMGAVNCADLVRIMFEGGGFSGQ